MKEEKNKFESAVKRSKFTRVQQDAIKEITIKEISRTMRHAYTKISKDIEDSLRLAFVTLKSEIASQEKSGNWPTTKANPAAPVSPFGAFSVLANAPKEFTPNEQVASRRVAIKIEAHDTGDSTDYTLKVEGDMDTTEIIHALKKVINDL